MADAKICDGCGKTEKPHNTTGQFPWFSVEPHGRPALLYDACSVPCLLAVARGMNRVFNRGVSFQPIFEDEEANA